MANKGYKKWWKVLPPEMTGEDQNQQMPQQQSGVQMTPIGNTGYGEDGKLQVDKPTHLINTNKGPRMLHEGENVSIGGQGQLSVQPNQKTLEKLEKEGMPGYKCGIKGYQTGVNYTKNTIASSSGHPNDSVTYVNIGGSEDVMPGIGNIGAPKYGANTVIGPSIKSGFAGASGNPYDYTTYANIGGGETMFRGIGSIAAPDYNPNTLTIGKTPTQIKTTQGAIAAPTPPTDLSSITDNRYRGYEEAKADTETPTDLSSITDSRYRGYEKEKAEAESPPADLSSITDNRYSGYKEAKAGAEVVPEAEVESETSPDIEMGMDFLRGIVGGDSQFWKNIANQAIQQMGGARAAGEAAQRQQAAGMGMSASQMATMMAVGDRDYGSEQSQLLGDLAGQFMAEGMTAAQNLITKGMDIEKHNQTMKTTEQDAKWTEFLRAAEYGSDEDVASAYEMYFGTPMTDTSMIADIRSWTRALKTEEVATAQLRNDELRQRIGDTNWASAMYKIDNNVPYGDGSNFDFDGDDVPDISFEDYNSMKFDREVQNATSTLTLTQLRRSVGANTYDEISGMLDLGVTWGEDGMAFDLNGDNVPDITEDQYLTMRDASVIGQREDTQALTYAGMLLENGQYDEAAEIFNDVYGHIEGFSDIDFSGLAEEDKWQDWSDGHYSLSVYANTYSASEFGQAYDAMKSDGTLKKLGLEDPAHKDLVEEMFNTQRVNAIDEAWEEIEGSDMYKKMSGEDKANQRAFFEAQYNGSLEWDFVQEYEIKDASGTVVATVPGEARAKMEIAGKDGWTMTETETIRVVPLDVLTGELYGAAETEFTTKQRDARAEVEVGETYTVDGKKYLKGEGSEENDKRADYTADMPVFDAAADAIIASGPGTEGYDDIVNARAAAYIQGDRTLNVGDLSADDPVYEALANDLRLAVNLGNRNLQYSGLGASEEYYAFDELEDVGKGEMVSIDGRLYELTGTEVIDRGGNDPKAYFLTDIETGERKFVAAYGNTRARITVDSPAPMESDVDTQDGIYEFWKDEDQKGYFKQFSSTYN
jgi:hypothetical protein